MLKFINPSCFNDRKGLVHCRDEERHPSKSIIFGRFCRLNSMYGEQVRKKFFERDIDFVRKKIIGKHRKCKGTGFLEVLKKTSEGFAKKAVTECSCRKNFLSKERLVLSNIPYESLVNQQIYSKVVQDCITGEQLDLSKEIIKPYIRSLKKALQNPYGFIFLGKNGTGKTFVGLKVLYYVVISGYTAHNIEFPDFLKFIRRAFRDDIIYDHLIDEIKKVDLLLIDEVGSESKRGDFSISELKSLIKTRISNHKPTIMVSNYSFEDFKKAYGVSVYSMITSHFKIFDFKRAADVRKAKCSVEMDSFFKELKRKK